MPIVDELIVRVEADVTELMERVDGAVLYATKQLGKIPDVNLNVDSSDAMGEFDRIRKTVEGTQDVDIELRLNVTKALRKMEGAVSKMAQELSEIDDPVEVQIATAKALRQARSAFTDIDRMTDQIDDVELRVDTRGLVEQVRSAYSRVEKELNKNPQGASGRLGFLSSAIDHAINPNGTGGGQQQAGPGDRAEDAVPPDAGGNIFSGMMDTFDKLSGKTEGVKRNMQELRANSGETLNSIMAFAKGQAPIEAVLGSSKQLLSALGGITKAAGPWGMAISAAAGVAMAGVDKVRQQLGDATKEIRQILDFDKITESTSNLGKVVGGMETAMSFERYTTEFTTLLKSKDNAQARIAEYADFGVTTPYNLPEIVQAGKLLQTFGGKAIATGDTLRLIGDTASSVGASFNEMAFWVGRAYTSMKAGRPWGEAAMRLQELAVLSGEERQQLEAMAKQGKTGAEVWEAFTGKLTKFSGGMENLSKTLGGMRSNLEDFQEQIALSGGEPMFDAEKAGLTSLLDYLGENEEQFHTIATLFGMMKAETIEFGTAWRDAFLEAFDITSVQDLLQWVNTLIAQVFGAREEMGELSIPTALGKGIQRIVEWMTVMVEKTANFVKVGTAGFKGVAGFLEMVWTLLKGLGTGIGFIIGLAMKLSPVFQTSAQYVAVIEEKFGGVGGALKSAFITFLQFLAMAEAGWKGFFAGIQPALEWLEAKFFAIKATGAAIKARILFDSDAAEKATKEAEEWGKKADEAIVNGVFDDDAAREESGKWLNIRKEGLDMLQEGVEPIEVPLKVIPDEVEAAVDPQAAEFQARLAKAQEFQDKFIKIEQNYNKNREEMQKKWDKEDKNRARDNAEKLEDMAESYQEKLEDMEENYLRSRAEAQEDYDHQTERMLRDRHIKEERAEEDFQRRMKEMKSKYLDDLEEAVKNRDARAIIKLQKDYAKQESEARRGEGERREREKEDNQRSDADRQQDFERRQQKADENYQRQKEKAAEQYQDQLDDMDKNLRRQGERRDEARQEQLDELNKALEKELEAMAIAMVDMADITEEGARHILETFNETFGVEGDIDKLMEDFSKRRAMKGTFSFNIEESFVTDQQKQEKQDSQYNTGEGQAGMYGGGYGPRNTPTSSPSYDATGSNLANQIATKSGLVTAREVREFIDYVKSEKGKQENMGDFIRPGTNDQLVVFAIQNYGERIPGLATGGMFMANKPTLLTVGERGPEIISASPVDQLARLTNSLDIGGGGRSGSSLALSGDLRVVVALEGNSAGVGQKGLEQAVSAVLVDALGRSGATDRNVYRSGGVKV